MKTRYILLSLFAVPAIVLAMPHVPYDHTKQPSLSLPAGYALAVDALGADTNQFYCISADINSDYGPPPRWHFIFSTTNTPPKFKWVFVNFDGKANVEEPTAIR